MKKVRAFAKKFISYRIERDVRIYQLKHTPVALRISLTKRAERKYGSLPIHLRKIIFDNYMGHGYGCNGKYVTEELLKRRKDLDIVWVVQGAAERKTEFPNGVRLVEYGTEQALEEYYTAAFWVCNYHLIAYWNKGLQKRAGQTYIQMWHGSLGIKKIENDYTNLRRNLSWSYLSDKNARNTDYWVSNSTFESDIYRRAFGAGDNILTYGHPRNDLFFGNCTAQIVEKVKKHIGVNSQTPVLLYVPTFREKDGEQRAFRAQKLDMGKLRTALRERTGEDWCMAVRLHPRMKGGIEEMCDGSDGVCDVTQYPDIQELLCAASAVVTDYSSCIFDFLLTRKPGFLYAPDIEAYHQERGFYYRLEETPFPIATTNDELAKCVAAFDAEAYRRRTDAFLKEKGCVEHGGASAKVCDLIESILLERTLQNGDSK